MDLLDRMLGHDRWATAQLLELCTTLTDAQLDQEFDIGHQTLRETLDHMIYVIDFWTGWMTGRPVEHDRTTQQYDRSITALTERHERYQGNFAELAKKHGATVAETKEFFTPSTVPNELEGSDKIGAALQATDLNPNDQLAWSSLSICYVKNGQIKEAESAGGKARILSWGGKIKKDAPDAPPTKPD